MEGDDNFYRPLEPILDYVNDKCVRINEEHKHMFRDIATKVVGVVIRLLRNGDPVFDEIFSRLDYVGSYYDGLRVKEATEFDINVIVRLPLNYKKIKVENTHAAAGYVKVNIKEAKDYVKYVDPCKKKRNLESHLHFNSSYRTTSTKYPRWSRSLARREARKVINKWCDEMDYLKQNLVRSWLEGILAKYFGNERIINVGHDSYRVQLRKSGPAFTLMIYVPNLAQRIDVDLVLTLEFPPDMRPPNSIRWVNELAASWIVVPKPLDTEWNKDLLWRISLPASERKLINAMQKLKLINRFLKAFRDAQNMNIASYYIKTEFLWEGHKIFYHEMDKRFWEKNKGVLFVYGLSELQKYLEQKRLPYYWHKNLNLFNSLRPDNAANMANRIKGVIKTINKYLTERNNNALRAFILAIFGIQEGNYAVHQTILSDQSAVELNLNNGGYRQEESSCTIL